MWTINQTRCPSDNRGSGCFKKAKKFLQRREIRNRKGRQQEIPQEPPKDFSTKKATRNVVRPRANSGGKPGKRLSSSAWQALLWLNHLLQQTHTLRPSARSNTIWRRNNEAEMTSRLTPSCIRSIHNTVKCNRRNNHPLKTLTPSYSVLVYEAIHRPPWRDHWEPK